MTYERLSEALAQFHVYVRVHDLQFCEFLWDNPVADRKEVLSHHREVLSHHSNIGVGVKACMRVYNNSTLDGYVTVHEITLQGEMKIYIYQPIAKQVIDVIPGGLSLAVQPKMDP